MQKMLAWNCELFEISLTWYWDVDGESYQKWEKLSFDVNNETAARHPTTKQGWAVQKCFSKIKLQMAAIIILTFDRNKTKLLCNWVVLAKKVTSKQINLHFKTINNLHKIWRI